MRNMKNVPRRKGKIQGQEDSDEGENDKYHDCRRDLVTEEINIQGKLGANVFDDSRIILEFVCHQLIDWGIHEIVPQQTDRIRAREENSDIIDDLWHHARRNIRADEKSNGGGTDGNHRREDGFRFDERADEEGDQ